MFPSPAKPAHSIDREFHALLAIDDQSLSTPEKRHLLAEELFRGGLGMDRTECHRFVEVLSDHRAGAPMIPELKAWMQARTALIEQWHAVETKRAEAWAKQQELDALKSRRAFLVDRLALQKGLLSDADGFLGGDLSASYFGFQVSGIGPTYQKLVEFGRDVAGLRESVALLRNKIVPTLEAELTAATAALTEFERQIATAATTTAK